MVGLVVVVAHITTKASNSTIYQAIKKLPPASLTFTMDSNNWVVRKLVMEPAVDSLTMEASRPPVQIPLKY